MEWTTEKGNNVRIIYHVHLKKAKRQKLSIFKNNTKESWQHI
jgi:hypothetical protein